MCFERWAHKDPKHWGRGEGEERIRISFVLLNPTRLGPI